MNPLLPFLAALAALSSAGVSVLTQANDAQRTGANLQESILDAKKVAKGFGLLWKLPADGKIMAQPLYVSGLKTAKCQAGCDAVIFATMKGTVYAYRADTAALLWSRSLGEPRPGSKDIDGWSTDDPWWGVLGTPVIDAKTGTLYAAAWQADKTYKLYALDLRNGAVKAGPAKIAGGADGRIFDSAHRKQRAGLLLDGGMVYVAFGGDTDNRPGMKKESAGWVFVFDAKDLSAQAIWTTVHKGGSGGIWQGGRGLAADGKGFIYLVTANGDFDESKADYSNSILKLKLENAPAGSALPKRLAVADFFSPCNQQSLSENDTGLGSAGPLLFRDKIATGSKQGWMYQTDQNRLGKFTPPPAGLEGDCQEAKGFELTDREPILSGPVYWKGPGIEFVYAWGAGNRLRAFPVEGGTFKPEGAKVAAWEIPVSTSAACPSSNTSWWPGGILSISADGAKPGSGIVWALVPANGDANQCRGVKGMLMAFDAEDVSRELWRGASFGLLSRFAAPTIAEGKVFVPTAGDEEPLHRYSWEKTDVPTVFPKSYYLAVFGLKP